MHPPSAATAHDPEDLTPSGGEQRETGQGKEEDEEKMKKEAEGTKRKRRRRGRKMLLLLLPPSQSRSPCSPSVQPSLSAAPAARSWRLPAPPRPAPLARPPPVPPDSATAAVSGRGSAAATPPAAASPPPCGSHEGGSFTAPAKPWPHAVLGGAGVGRPSTEFPLYNHQQRDTRALGTEAPRGLSSPTSLGKSALESPTDTSPFLSVSLWGRGSCHLSVGKAHWPCLHNADDSCIQKRHKKIGEAGKKRTPIRLIAEGIENSRPNSVH